MKRVLTIAKGVWVVVILGAFAWYLVNYWSEFSTYASDVGVVWILGSLALFALCRVFLAAGSVESLRGVPHDLALGRAIAIYSLSLLGRYIPGSIWQYLGRIAFYKAEGISAKKGMAALVVESYWLLGTGAAFGAALSMPQLAKFSGLELAPALIAALSVLIALLWLLAMVFGSRILARRVGLGALRPLRAAALQLTIWTLFGIAFWALFPPEVRTLQTFVPALGIYALAWAAGYVVPFAPAGLGVREAVLIALLTGLLTPAVAAAAAAMSRVLFTALELGVGLVVSLVYARPPEVSSNG